jgi:hypothetical protein
MLDAKQLKDSKMPLAHAPNQNTIQAGERVELKHLYENTDYF